MKTQQTTTKISIGIDALKDLPDLVRAHGTHPLLVHGHRPVEDGLLEKVRVLLTQAGIPHTDLGQILPNPKFNSVKRGIRKAQEEGCDLILSLGGGSTLQCAKGIAYGLKFDDKNGKLWDLWEGKAKPQGAAPVAAVLTNPATGAELNDACTLVRDGKQKTLHSPYGQCAFAVLDPTLSMLPYYPTVNQIFGIFSYIFIRYLDSSEQDGQKDLKMMQDLLKCADQLEANIEDAQARTTLFQVGLEAHQVSQKIYGNLNGLADTLSYQCSLPRGTATSAVFFAWANAQIPSCTAKMSLFAKTLFGIEASDQTQAAEQGIQSLMERVQKMNMAVCIPDTGLVLKKHDLKALAADHDQYEVLKKANKPVQKSK
ncbi:MAG: iron-containing alcohol dehydrogenase [Erysipelotrichaceae bacterium]|nr:iron-containing alcohol dehydrogenase [Erysipelotrichaceae bacterium]